MNENRELRRTYTLSEQLAASDHHESSSSEDENSDDNNTNTKNPKSTRYNYENYDKSRTLLDIIKDEHEVDDSLISHAAATDTMSNSSIGLNWQSFKERLRLCRAGSAAFRAAISHPSHISDPELAVNPSPQQPAFFHSFSRAVSVRNVNAGRETDNSDEGDNEEAEKVEEENVGTISLMALLGQSDDQWDDEEDEENTEGLVGECESEKEDGGEVETACCVCMVRHKGAAFIPCGHTFCRLCSRELWVSRGNCPLCNAFILEILDIF